MTNFTKFLRDDSGAVTIDWVALTAGILLLGIAVVTGVFTTGVTSLAEDINTNLVNASPSDENTLDFTGGGLADPG